MAVNTLLMSNLSGIFASHGVMATTKLALAGGCHILRRFDGYQSINRRKFPLSVRILDLFEDRPLKANRPTEPPKPDPQPPPPPRPPPVPPKPLPGEEK